MNPSTTTTAHDTPLHRPPPFTQGDHVIPTSTIQRIYAQVELAVARHHKAITCEGPSCHGKSITSRALHGLFVNKEARR